ncbi:MAG: HAMP domain-containing protein [Sulfuricella sp.]|nr:HAMP domain-containing protein [Sulfuricella sp.]
MKPSILRNLLYSYLGFGLTVALIFPFYANIFVNWKEGMLVWFVAGCIVAGLMIGVANYWLLNAILLSKLRRISEVANAIAAKDLSFRCGIQSDDTIGEIILSFNNMTQNLRDLIGQTGSLSSNVRDDVNSIHRFMEGITHNLDEQTARTGDVGLAVDGIAQTFAQIAENSEAAATKSREAAGLARDGSAIMQSTIQGMAKINSVVGEAAQSVETLGENSEKIGTIVSVIEEIAGQTNLLALNAAIEAARAGEQGRGFAVVADEVRKLAEKTGQATAEIGEVIQTIQKHTDYAVKAIQAGASEVQNGVVNANAAGASLDSILASAAQATIMVEDIASAANRSRDGMESVRANINDIAALSSGNLQNTREGTAKAEHLSALARELDGNITGFRLAA